MMSSEGKPTPPRADDKVVKAAFAVMALLSVLAGLGIYLLQARLGLDEDTAQLISTAFLVVGMGDTLLLYLWDRVFKRRG